MQSISGPNFSAVPLDNSEILNTFLTEIDDAIESHTLKRIFLFWNTKRYWDEYSLVSYFNSKKAIVGIDIIEGYGKTELVLLELKKGTKMPKLSS